MARSSAVFVSVLLLFLIGTGLMLLRRLHDNAAQAECALHLKRIGEGILFFQGDAKVLREAKLDKAPAKGQGTLPASFLAPAFATWPVEIAPYLSADGPLKKWDLQQSYFAQPAEVRQAALPLFFCPARSRESRLSRAGDAAQPGGKNVPGGLGDYACASGDGNPRHDWKTAAANGAIIPGEVLEERDERILRWRSRTDFAALQRGQGYTILVGEKHVPLGKFGLAEVGDGSIYNGANPASFARVGGPGFGIASGPTEPFHSNFGSYHPGVCQFLMADGSVRAIHNEISAEVLGRLVRRE